VLNFDAFVQVTFIYNVVSVFLRRSVVLSLVLSPVTAQSMTGERKCPPCTVDAAVQTRQMINCNEWWSRSTDQRSVQLLYSAAISTDYWQCTQRWQIIVHAASCAILPPVT